MSGITERKALHDLVDELPDVFVSRVLSLVREQLELGADDTLTPEEEARVEAAKASARAGRIVSHDDVMRRYGLNDE